MNIKSQFLLDPKITFLNFGSFGSCPKPIFEDYQNWQLLLEKEPVQFIAVEGPKNLKASRAALASFINCDADDLVYMPNPSHAINLIAKSFDLKPGDEVLTTDLEYGAMDRTWNYYCNKKGAKYIQQPIELPLTTKEKFIEDFFKGLTPKTKVIFISQITSSTGLILPAKEICEIAKQKGLFTIVDGAHVPGHIPLNLQELEADVYTGACHKWMLTAKGSSFLYVKKQYQPLFDPLVVSWGYQSAAPSHSQFIDYHELQGTRDFSAFLTIPKAIQFMKEHNWTERAAECRKLVQANAKRFCDLVGTKPLCPISDEFLGQLFSIPIRTPEPEKLQLLLFQKYQVEIPVMRHETKVYLRYSIQAFNTQQDLDTLYNALKDIIATTKLIEV